MPRQSSSAAVRAKPRRRTRALCAALLCACSFAAMAGPPALGERLNGFYAREGNNGTPAAAAGNNIYLKFFEDRWIVLLFVPYPYASGVTAPQVERALQAARARTDSAAYLRGRFGEFDANATAQVERYGYLGERIAFECGALSACTIRLGDGYLELIKPGVINEHIVRYHHVAAD